MLPKAFSQKVQFYQDRFGFKKPFITEKPRPDTRVIIAIPCYNEPNLLGTLSSLLDCLPPKYPTEIIIGVNAGSHVDAAIRQQNEQTMADFQTWKQAHLQEMSQLTFHLLYADDLPPKHEEAFSNQAIQSAAIHFEHPYESETATDLKEGIINYELYLRYYTLGVRQAGFPYHHHTVGSSMAVRASTYALTGGMNRRKAGEDFYFMHKMMPQGKVVHINDTCVYPSCRLSDRVPFGTGRAQLEWMKNEKRIFLTYHPQIFKELKLFIHQIKNWYEINAFNWEQMPMSIVQFMEQQAFEKEWKRLKKGTKNYLTFRKQFFSWFDGFKVLKFVHFARDHHYPNIPLQEAATILLNYLYKFSEGQDLEELLHYYRALDQKVT